MNAHHRRTLAAIFERPTPSDIRWSDVEALLLALGAEVSEGSGSRVRVALNGVRQVFHRPHPKPVTGRATIRDVREMLIRAGAGL